MNILFSHPADFTPVCTSEILEIANLQDDFKKLNVELFVLSTDGINSHIEWVNSIESIEYKDRGNTEINFPLISDAGLSISKKYGMIHPNSSNTKNVRAVFIIDPDDKVQAIFYYPMSVGRNIDEIKRTLIALQMVDKKNVYTPANWNPGNDVLLPAPATVSAAQKLESKNDPEVYSVTWYMWFRAGL